MMRYQFHRSAVVFLLAGLGMGACADVPADEVIEPVTSPITGGAVTKTCEWPTTVQLSGCTGTLVHPLVVTTAAHCGTGHRTAIFGETRTMPARTIPIEFCRRFTGAGDGTTRTDWAVCKLTQPVTDIPIIPILMGCETEILKPMQKVVVAGFGRTEANEGGSGTKRWVETTVNRVDTGRGIQVGGMGKAPCFGDSGGPAFVKLPDGSWRVFGIDSVGTGASCAAGDLMTLIHKGVAWMEQQVNIDITPCHDADGKWNPSAACRGFSMEPMAAGRAWANGCAEPMLSPPAMTCGAPFGGDGGLPPPPPPPPPDANSADTAIDRGRPEAAADTGAMTTDAARPETPGSGSGDAAEDRGQPTNPPPPAGSPDGGDAARPGGGLSGPSGCSCRLDGQPGSSGNVIWIGLVLAACAAIRRRRR